MLKDLTQTPRLGNPTLVTSSEISVSLSQLCLGQAVCQQKRNKKKHNQHLQRGLEPPSPTAMENRSGRAWNLAEHWL